MLISDYSPSEIISNSSVKAIDATSYSVGGTEIVLEVNADFNFVVTIDYLAPMSSSFGMFGNDKNQKLKFKFAIKAFSLTRIKSDECWEPSISLVENKLYLHDLPRGRVEIKCLAADLTTVVYYAYFQTERQVPGVASLTNAIELNANLYRAAANNDLHVRVSAIAATVSLIEQYGYIPNQIPRLVNDNFTPELKIDLGSNLVTALWLLTALSKWRAKPLAQQLDTGIELRIKSAIDLIAQQAVAALDLRTGLVFATKEFDVYSNPSYIATAVAIILWHELSGSHNYHNYLIPLAKSWTSWSIGTYNPNLETLTAFQFALLLLDRYQQNEIKSNVSLAPTQLFDCSNLDERYYSLMAFVPNISIALPEKPPKLITLPRTTINSFDSAVALTNTAKALYLQAQTAMMPTGYLWPTAEQLTKRSSIWGGFFRTTSQTLASSFLLTSAKTNTFKLEATSNSNLWLAALFPIPVGTPVGYWRALSNAYFKAPKIGTSAIEWIAYLSGFNPISITLIDYNFVQRPSLQTIANYPSLTTINSIDPKTYYPAGADVLYPLDPLRVQGLTPTAEIVYLNSTLDYATPDRLADQDTHPLDLSQHSNYLNLYGEGKPIAVATNCLQKLPAGTVCNLYCHTWTVTKDKPVTTSFNSLDTFN